MTSQFKGNYQKTEIVQRFWAIMLCCKLLWVTNFHLYQNQSFINQ